jgi:lipopolysaccharide/colanic/teichoic acid biosynthesis glycosyltransferase
MTLGIETDCEYSVADGPDFAFSAPTHRVHEVRNDGIVDRWLGTYRGAGRSEPTLLGLSRVLDICGALAILLIALPFLVILSIALKLDSSGPLFFVQRRIGLGGREFSCIKFRTMCKDADAALKIHLMISSEARAEWARDHKLRNDPRITRLGGIVRKLSLDEFPQLINILRGEMSLVGPRPIVSSEVTRYGRYFEEYCQVRPGLTGLWQVSGRNDVTYRRRVSIDCYYVRNKSLLLDLTILFRTVPVVLGAKGSY